ncbi:cyclic nucleotide-binding domain-containing protein [Mycobacterium sp.]|uniref:cyclic nucleotide-binding domain-containing protein n=1 Tax=Mycobacterium sp. TaxID=1785 RepID=UPI003A8A9870
MKVDGNQQNEDGAIARRLREFPAFGDFSDSELELLARTAHHSVQADPWPLIQEQTPSDACFILLSGEAGVYVGEDRVAVVGPGEVIGESALRRDALRTATVTTIGPAEVLRIERDSLNRLLKDIPALRETMEATAAKHVAAAPPPKPKPENSKLSASIPTDLLKRFEKAADAAGMSVAAALQDAVKKWVK